MKAVYIEKKAEEIRVIEGEAVFTTKINFDEI
jgi:hypothetical protein